MPCTAQLICTTYLCINSLATFPMSKQLNSVRRRHSIPYGTKGAWQKRGRITG